MKSNANVKVHDWVDDLFRWPTWSFSTFPSFDLILDKPRVEVYEEGGNLRIEAEVPGLSPTDVNVELNGDLLTISAKKDEASEDGGRKSYRNSSLYRSFRVGNVNSEDVMAKVENGLLSVTLPSTKPEVKKIEVK